MSNAKPYFEIDLHNRYSYKNGLLKDARVNNPEGFKKFLNWRKSLLPEYNESGIAGVRFETKEDAELAMSKLDNSENYYVSELYSLNELSSYF